MSELDPGLLLPDWPRDGLVTHPGQVFPGEAGEVELKSGRPGSPGRGQGVLGGSWKRPERGQRDRGASHTRLPLPGTSGTSAPLPSLSNCFYFIFNRHRELDSALFI